MILIDILIGILLTLIIFVIIYRFLNKDKVFNALNILIEYLVYLLILNILMFCAINYLNIKITDNVVIGLNTGLIVILLIKNISKNNKDEEPEPEPKIESNKSKIAEIENFIK